MHRVHAVNDRVSRRGDSVSDPLYGLSTWSAGAGLRLSILISKLVHINQLGRPHKIIIYLFIIIIIITIIIIIYMYVFVCIYQLFV